MNKGRISNYNNVTRLISNNNSYGAVIFQVNGAIISDGIMCDNTYDLIYSGSGFGSGTNNVFNISIGDMSTFGNFGDCS